MTETTDNKGTKEMKQKRPFWNKAACAATRWLRNLLRNTLQRHPRMGRTLLRLKLWWQRNFGHVYLWRGDKDSPWYRFRARRGRVALVWSTVFEDIGFVCRLREDGAVVIDDDYYAGYGKQYGSWVWAYEPKGKCAGKGGFW